MARQVHGVWAPLIALAMLAPASRATFVQFTVSGETTFSRVPSVSVGDPFEIKYVANAVDQNPSTNVGSFSATGLTIAFPNLTVSYPTFAASVAVSLNNADGTDYVRYWNFFPNTFSWVWVVFPAGTLNSDALPLTLPISEATSADFLDYGFGTQFQGDIHTYAGVEVPEPRVLHIGWPLLVALRRRHHG